MEEKHTKIYEMIGNAIRSRRVEKGWSQEQLAHYCESVNREKISKLENARVDFMMSTLLEILDALDLEIKLDLKAIASKEEKK